MKISRISIIAVLAGALMAANCTTSTIEQPGGPTYNGGLKMASFDVKGQTVGKACAGIFGGDDTNQRGYTTGWRPLEENNGGILDLYVGVFTAAFKGVKSPAANAAMHDALSKVPDANFFLETSSISEWHGFLIFGTECVTVRGHAIQLKGPSDKNPY